MDSPLLKLVGQNLSFEKGGAATINRCGGQMLI
jgi:hypothetical protein